VRIANASVYRDGHPSITHLTWTWHPGEHWLVTGPNGAGKSTLLRLLYAAERPARHGRIEWAGHPAPFDIRALRRGIGYVSPALQSDYRYYATVEQCVLSGHHASLGLVRPVSGDERRRARDWLERLALDHLASRPVERLSYGQFRRVLIARAMVTEPRLLLLDEADSTLDQAARTSVYAALAEARATGTHLALATHTPDDAAPLFTHRLRLAEGRLISATPLAAQNRVSA
jgi:ABC-type molybdenum transport system ATPase subunit/photorepair protein PhrA